MSAPQSRRRLRAAARFVFAGVLGTGLALLVACGSSNKGLIPSGRAGPLLADFVSVQRAAEQGGGNCSATDAALSKTEKDLAALPSSLNSGLRNSLRQGVENLSARAHELCTQPPTQGTTTGASTSTATSPRTTPTTTSTSTNTTPTTTPKTEEGESKEHSGAGGVTPEENSAREKSGGAESEERPSGGAGGGSGGAGGESGAGAGGSEGPK